MDTLFLLAALLVSPAPDASGACPPVPSLPSLVCEATPHGWFYADSAQAAREAADEGAATAAAFQRYLGRAAPAGATVLSARFPMERQEVFASQHALPYLRVWIPAEAKAAMIEESLRRSMPHLSDEQVGAIVQRAHQSSGDILRHELGHSVYRAVFWPRHSPDDGHYATPAPDWLDEASAILMEPETMLAGRRAQFRQWLHETPEQVSPPSVFLSRPHPFATAEQRARLAARSGGQAANGTVAAVVSGDGAKAQAGFYLQSLAMADFLIECSGRQDLLGEISQALADGMGFDAWLTANGLRHQLGANVKELDRNWSAWVNAQREAPTQ